MANPIQIKRSSTASSVPAAGSLLVGELAVNLADKKLYTKDGGGTVILLAKPTPGTSSQLLASDGSGGYAAVTVGSGLSLSGGTLASTSGGGSVTTVSVVTANGVSGTVANASSTPAITLSLGAINPTSVGATTPGTGAFTTLSTTGAIAVGNADTNLYRSAANTLATDDAFIAAGSVNVTGAAATGRYVNYRTAGVDRWSLWAINDAESGGDAGSTFAISYYSDAGAYKSDALQISRVTGATLFPEKLVTIRQNDSREVRSDSLYLNNIAAATATYDQFSPSLHLKGDGWYTSGSSRKNCHWWVTVQPEQGTSNPTNALVFASDTSDTPTATERVRFTDSGVKVAGSLQAPNLRLDNADVITWGGVYGAGIPAILGSSSAGELQFRPTGSTSGTIATISSTGLTVTGAISATGVLTTTGLYQMNSTGDLDTTGTCYISLRDNSTGSYVERGWLGFGTGDGNLDIANNVTSKGVRIRADSSIVATFSSSGLAVTGALSATTGISYTNTNTIGFGNDGPANANSLQFSYNGQNYINAYGGSSAAVALRINGTNVGNFTTTGLVVTGNITGTGVYSTTTGSAANVYVDSSGLLQRSTSSIKYKRDVQDYSRGLTELMSLRPVFYKGKSESDGDRQFAGLIAEEVHDAGLTEFVQYDKDGKPDALAYQNMVALLIASVKQLTARVAELEANA